MLAVTLVEAIHALTFLVWLVAVALMGVIGYRLLVIFRNRPR